MANSVRVRLDPALYPPSAVADAMTAFANHAILQCDDAATGSVVIETTAVDHRTVDEFLNYALMAAIEVHLAQP